jgi:hypothetical protein
VVRRDIYGRSDAFIDAGLQSEQADNGLAAARVHLDDGVALCARFIPFVQNIALHIAQIGVPGQRSIFRLPRQVR